MSLPIRKSLQALADLAGIADDLWQEAGEAPPTASSRQPRRRLANRVG